MKNNILYQIVKTWNLNPIPEYRGFRCANCQSYMRKAWHHWVDHAEFLYPVHFCNDCQQKYVSNTLEVIKPTISHQHDIFGNYPTQQKNLFKEICSKWNTKKTPVFKIFTCDVCNTNHITMHHVWEYASKKYIELHFCKNCWEKMNN